MKTCNFAEELIKKGYDEKKITMIMKLSGFDVCTMLEKCIGKNAVEYLLKKLLQSNEIVKKEEIILLDTSIVNIYNIMGLIALREKQKIIVPSIVISETEKLKKAHGYIGYNARKIIDKARLGEFEVIISSTSNELKGWKGKYNDNIIINCAVELSTAYDVVIYTCDEDMVIRATSVGIRTVFKKSGAKSSTTEKGTIVRISCNDIPFNTSIFESVEDHNKKVTFNFVTDSFDRRYLPYCKEYPYIYTIRNDRVLRVHEKLFIKLDDFLFKLYPDRIEEYVVSSKSESSNAIHIKTGYFKVQVNSIKETMVGTFIIGLK